MNIDKGFYIDQQNIYRSTDKENWLLINSGTNEDNLTVTDVKLNENTTYYYKVTYSNRYYNIESDIVSVTTGHGVIQLVNTQVLEGGWLSLNHKNYYKITENMQLEVPEGTYELTVAGNGYGGSTEVAVTRNEQISVDVESIKGEDPK